MKRIIFLMLSLFTIFSLSSCSSKEESKIGINDTNTDHGYTDNIQIEQTGFTREVPDEYFSSISKQGKVVSLTYDSIDYLRGNAKITKTAYVYLPYGYDEDDADTRYDIFYLMHGWYGHAGEYFETANVKNMLDNMIEKGDIKPTIFVSPSFYNSNSSNDFSASVSELRLFHKDFENHLMPAVEGKYHTYALSTTKEDLENSRDHRGFGGFSLGSVTTWMQFCENSKYIRYFLPMSGSSWYYGGYGNFQIERNVDHIEEVVEANGLEDKGYFIYHAVGTNDSVKSQTVDMASEMLKRERFTKDHYVFYQKEGGQHDYYALREFMYNALPLMFKSGSSFAKYTLDTKIDEVINDPVFDDYGRLIFPVNDSYYSGSTLKDLRLTWFNYIDPNKTVEIVNYMKGRVIEGEEIFYDIYTEEEMEEESSLKNTGLFFFKGNRNAKFAICNAGGGMAYVGAMHDSFPHALELSKKGYNAFALIYRTGFDTAMKDLARAIAFIHEHKDELEVDVEGYSLWGGSAGARMSAELGSYPTSHYGEKEYPRPSVVIMQYTGLSTVYGNEPPTYNCVGTSDGIASYQTMQNRINRIKANGTDAMIEIFDNLPHGFGLGTGTIAEGWIDNAIAFWERSIK